MKMEKKLMTLSSLSCVVKFNSPTSKLESSASGTIIHPFQGLVLSHGSILAEHLTENKLLSAKVRDGKLLHPGDLSGSDFNLLLSNHLVSSQLPNIENQNALMTSCSSSAVATEKDQQNKDPVSNFTQVQCHFICAFRNNDFHKTLNEMMPSSVWTFNDGVTDGGVNDAANGDSNSAMQESDTNASSEILYHLLSYFLLFKFKYSDLGIPKDLLKTSNQTKNSSLVKNRRGKCFIGETAEIIATPFSSLCPHVFFNGYSRGVISNVSGVNDCWIVTDARCIPGCEGGPLYTKMRPTDSESFLTGIITSPLCWKNNEWVGFSVSCSIDSILRSMAKHKEIFPRSKRFPTLMPKQKSPAVKDLLQVQAMTVLVQCNSSWGTGIILDGDQGVILTCSHVVRGIDVNSVTVTPSKSVTKYRGEIVYRQDPVGTPYDLAVIKCPPATKHLPKGWSVAVAQASVGEDILLSGHAVFSTDRHLQPSVSRGVVSKVVGSKDNPAMVQTTCAVHAGSSGGPLLTPDCQLVGIAVCNTRDSATNSSFPHVNLCIPVSTVWPVLQYYLSSGDKDCLSQLRVQDVELNQLWTLGAQSSHKTEDVPPISKL